MDRGSWYCTAGRDQDYPHEKETQKGQKWFSDEVLQIAEKRREVKGKGKIHTSECSIPKNSKER